MALQWKEILRSDGDLLGKVGGTAVATIKTGASAGTTAKTLTDATFTSNILNIANTNAASKNSAISLSAAGVLSGAGGGTVTPSGIGAVDTDLSNAPTGIVNSNTTAGDVGLGSVLNQAQTSTFRQDAIPTALAAGDIWFDTNANNKLYSATALGDNEISSSEWVEVSIGKAALGLDSGDVGLGNVDNDSTSTIRDGVTAGNVGLGSVLNQAQITSFAQDAIPVSLAIGDMWSDTNDNNKMYRAASVGADAVTAGEWIEVGIKKGSLGLLKGDVGLGSVDNDSTSTIRTGTTKTHVGLGSVSDITSSAMMALNLTGTIGGTANATIKSGAAAGATANQDSTTTILGGNLTGTIGGVANATLRSGAASGATANQDATSTILGGNLTGTIGGTANATVLSGAVLGGSSPRLFRQDGVPTALNAGDMWIDSNDNNKSYRATATGDDAVTAGEWIAITPSKGAVGLGNVDDESKATMFGSPTFTGTVAGVTKTHVGLSAVTNESKATMFSAPTFTGTVSGVTKAAVGLSAVDNESSADIKAAAVTTATGNILGTGTAENLNTLKEFADALGDDASFASTMTTSLAAKDAVKVTMTSATAPAATGYSVGRQGTFSNKLYIVVNE